MVSTVKVKEINHRIQEIKRNGIKRGRIKWTKLIRLSRIDLI